MNEDFNYYDDLEDFLLSFTTNFFTSQEEINEDICEYVFQNYWNFYKEEVL